jgi:hypothetical protein
MTDDYEARPVTCSGSVAMGKKQAAKFRRFVEAIYGWGRWKSPPGYKQTAISYDTKKGRWNLERGD